MEFRRVLFRSAVGDVGARDAGGECGTERDRIAAAILERVHLLRDDIGGLTERAREHGRRLEHRDFEALEAIEPPHAIEHIGDAREAALVLAENVLRAADAVGGVDTGHKRGVLYARRGEIARIRSEERRVGKEWVSPLRVWLS